jgi:hypothetical protein
VERQCWILQNQIIILKTGGTGPPVIALDFFCQHTTARLTSSGWQDCEGFFSSSSTCPLALLADFLWFLPGLLLEDR